MSVDGSDSTSKPPSVANDGGYVYYSDAIIRNATAIVSLFMQSQYIHKLAALLLFGATMLCANRVFGQVCQPEIEPNNSCNGVSLEDLRCGLGSLDELGDSDAFSKILKPGVWVAQITEGSAKLLVSVGTGEAEGGDTNRVTFPVPSTQTAVCFQIVSGSGKYEFTVKPVIRKKKKPKPPPKPPQRIKCPFFPPKFPPKPRAPAGFGVEAANKISAQSKGCDLRLALPLASGDASTNDGGGLFQLKSSKLIFGKAGLAPDIEGVMQILNAAGRAPGSFTCTGEYQGAQSSPYDFSCNGKMQVFPEGQSEDLSCTGSITTSANQIKVGLKCTHTAGQQALFNLDGPFLAERGIAGKLGDLNDDGVVNLTDFAFFQSCYRNDKTKGIPLNCQRADFDRDLSVTSADFDSFLDVLADISIGAPITSSARQP